jgi:hypothetical protein
MTTIAIIYFKTNRVTASLSYENVLFTSKKVITSGVPNTVIFEYDISQVEYDSAFIQQTWDSRRRMKISGDNKYHTSVYYFPGYHKAKLVLNDKPVKEHTIHITTKGWLALATNTLYDEIPLYIPETEMIMNNSLHVTPAVLRKREINTSDPSLNILYGNVRNFQELTGDNFILETRIKNDTPENPCQTVYLYIMCEEGIVSLPFTNPGCVSTLSLIYGDHYADGKNNDLSVFGCDLSEWNDIRCEVKDYVVKISINKALKHQLLYNRTMGKIVGFVYRFSGCGAVDYIKLTEEQGKIVFEDNFTR